ncbi:uncharacterized protein LOC127702202 [Mytilus californianus]|uniref:uncharacterized protein LOC127702202 n=1 Tax=Mytilus californianus TaxID=6549 RepID=UPI0022485704|nr:uncharacterized protein LOC127702202 [Mytilus californianus]
MWVFVWMVFMLFMSEAKVTWNVEKQITDYGEDLELFCNISDDYKIKSQKSKRWYRGSEQKLLTINDVDKPKYSASIESNGFKLIIKNLTENDVNVTYQCEYGFTKSENLLLLAKDVFIKDLPGHKEEAKESGGKIAVILGIVFAVLIFIVIPVCVIYILYKRGQLVMVTEICKCNGEPQNAEDQYDGVQYNPVPPRETNGTKNQQTNIVIDNEANRCCHHPSNEDQYDGVRYNPVPPYKTNGTDNQQTNIANGCHHPSNEVPFEDIETTGNASYISQTEALSNQVTVLCDNKMIERSPGTSHTPQECQQPVIVTSFTRLGGCKAQQSQQSYDEEKETSHAADTERSIVSSQQEEGALSNSECQITKPNQEEEYAISSRKFPAYSKKRVREQSFTEWSLNSPSIQKMASAGFFYKGCNTYAQCFCCGFNQKWRENDDPLRSSSHYDDCSYSQKVNDSSAQDSNPSSPDSEQTIPKSMELPQFL